MSLDQLDKKIQDAANQYEPVYNEQAWSSMKKLLDEKMPEKKKNKRRLLWIFLLIFIVAATFLLMQPRGKDNVSTISAINNSIKISSVSDEMKSANSSNTISKNTRKNLFQPSRSFINKSLNKQTFFEKSINKKTEDQIAVDDYSTLNNNSEIHKIVVDKLFSGIEKNDLLKQSINTQSFIEPVKSDAVSLNNNKTHETENINSSIQERIKNYSHKDIQPSHNKNKFNNSFALNFSAGQDVSAVNIDNIGKINFLFGAGVSYSFGNKFTVRTGIFIVKKVYAAKASDYHPPSSFWNYYPNLSSIEANCKVYEVPLIVNYNFSKTSKRLWFVSAGVSSYFMKKENYDYYSKNPSGQYNINSYSISNQNKHYLSSIRLSGGYQRILSNNIAILAEPYFNLPLSGIGFGKVKLYSSGIIFTLSVKPFSKK